MLIMLSRKSSDKGMTLHMTIINILKEEAKAITKGPQKNVEMRNIDDITTKKDIQSARQIVTGESCVIPLVEIKIRFAYRDTQAAIVTLPISIVRKCS